jgi:hypothetical protein
VIPAEEQAQRQAALRALLAKPLLVSASDAEALLLVRRHLPALSDWLRRETGWRLAAGTEMARLFKTTPLIAEATHPARGRNREPFSRRRYVVLCLALSALARADTQTTLGSLADDVLTAAAEPGLATTGFTLSLDTRSDRADLVAVVRLLLGWGVLTLVDEPVLYYDELTEDEHAYLVSQRHNITGRISEATGLLPELRAEGIAMVDPDDELTDVRMPEQRTDGHLTLLVAEYLATRERTPRDELLGFVRQAADDHANYWRKGVTDPGAEIELLDTALEKLTALRLVENATEVTRDGTTRVVRTRPAIARFALADPTIREPGRPAPNKAGPGQTRKAAADAASTIF